MFLRQLKRKSEMTSYNDSDDQDKECREEVFRVIGTRNSIPFVTNINFNTCL